jgi:hypothetical protein
MRKLLTVVTALALTGAVQPLRSFAKIDVLKDLP